MPNLIGNEKLQFDGEGNPYFLRTISTDGKTEKILPEQCTLPMVKELSVFVVLKREGYTPDMRRKVWYGLQQLQIKISSNDSRFRYHYLIFDKKAMDGICVTVLNPYLKDTCGNYNRSTWNMSLNPKKMEDESYEYAWIHFVGKAKQITKDRLKELQQNKEILAVLNDDGSERCE